MIQDPGVAKCRPSLSSSWIMTQVAFILNRVTFKKKSISNCPLGSAQTVIYLGYFFLGCWHCGILFGSKATEGKRNDRIVPWTLQVRLALWLLFQTLTHGTCKCFKDFSGFIVCGQCLWLDKSRLFYAMISDSTWWVIRRSLVVLPSELRMDRLLYTICDHHAVRSAMKIWRGLKTRGLQRTVRMFKPGGGVEDFKDMLHTLHSCCRNVELMKNEGFTVVFTR